MYPNCISCKNVSYHSVSVDNIHYFDNFNLLQNVPKFGNNIKYMYADNM